MRKQNVCSRIDCTRHAGSRPEEYGVMAQLAAIALVEQDPALVGWVWVVHGEGGGER